MMRVLVVDDEQPVVDGLCHLIGKDESGDFQVVGQARSGREAVDKARALSPDIMLLDVNMPGLSGLDAAREIRKRGDMPVFILVTAYERFDIALEAVQLGIVDYLLKPVQKSKLAEALAKAADLVRKRAESERGELERREAEDRLLPLARHGVLRALMMGEGTGPAFADALGQVGWTAPWCLAAVLSFQPPAGCTDRDDWARSAYGQAASLIEYKAGAMLGPLSGTLCAALAPLSGLADAGRAEAVVSDALAPVLDSGRVRLAFGPPELVAEASESYRVALSLLSGDGASVRPAEDGPEPGAGSWDFEADFLDGLRAGSVEKARLALESVLPPAGVPVGSALRSRLAGALSVAYADLARRGLMDDASALAALDLGGVAGAADTAALAAAVRTRFAELGAAATRGPRRSRAVAAALDYITANFSSPLSLESTASAAGVSPGHLSRLFTDELGMGFTDYLIDARIRRARELLSEPGASVKEVSMACGYSDPNYFSRLFKKVCGLSPTAYAAGIREETDD
ncbi:MAG: response regulator [Spirochaetales bacterium]|nr:response regulator [Spirochaetales bacterium]